MEVEGSKCWTSSLLTPHWIKSESLPASTVCRNMLAPSQGRLLHWPVPNSGLSNIMLAAWNWPCEIFISQELTNSTNQGFFFISTSLDRLLSFLNIPWKISFLLNEGTKLNIVLFPTAKVFKFAICDHAVKDDHISI
jgi:hypothetical protein